MSAWGWLRCPWVRPCGGFIVAGDRCTRWRWHRGAHRYEVRP